jgi:CubicO group peptidase (beta-lactamase class C family)
MRRKSLALALFAAAITAASARQNNNPAAAFDRVREFIKQQLSERRLPSVAVAVARDGQIIWEEAFGWADSEKRIPATPHTMHSLASISKPFTATGLMILKERGRQCAYTLGRVEERVVGI